jgi:hypothetical protein
MSTTLLRRTDAKQQKVPVFASLSGDVFFRSDGGFWWLDTLVAA